MRCVVQRVSRAAVRVEGEVVGEIGGGLLVLAAFAPDDTADELGWTARKLPDLRLFGDDAGLMNRSLREVGGGILLVSQFTLYGDLSRGLRPSFTGSAPPAAARRLYEEFAGLLRAQWPAVAEGRFGAAMAVELVNDGPVTLILDRERARGRTAPAC
ncbi:MAG: D-aminoacyl-tRNA deacylase [bacterium]|nr:D-aminoacyl-tRNA deacylase [bacterium]